MASYKDLQGREITEGAYIAQQKAGTDVSGYTKIEPTAPVTPTTPKKVEMLDPITIEQGQKPVETQVQPQSENKSESLKVETAPTTTEIKKTDFQDNSDKAMKNIINNLKALEKSNPNLFLNQDNYRKALSYGDRTDRQQTLLDTYFQSKAKQQQAQNQIIDTNKQNQIQANKLSEMTVDQLYDKGLSDDEKLQLQQSNPDLYNSYLKKVSDENKLSIINGTTTKGFDINSVISKFLDFSKSATSMDLVQEYKNNIKELEPLQTQLATQKKELDDLNLEMDGILDATRKTYANTGATEGEIRARAGKQLAELQKQYNTKVNAYNALNSEYTSKSNNIDKMMSLQQQQYQNELQQRNQKMSELGFAVNLYQMTPEYQTQQMQIKYDFENPDIDSTDEATSKRALKQSLDSYYKDFGGIIQRSEGQVISDVINYSKTNNVSVSQALQDNFIKPLQGKSEYKLYQAKALGLSSSDLKLAGLDVTLDENGNWTLKNTPTSSTSGLDLTNPVGLGDLSGSTLVSQYPNEASFKNNNPTGIKFNVSNNLKQLLTNAGISFSQGTTSPEGGAYMKFETMEDGLNAYKTILTKASYDDVYNRLKQWKGVGDTEGYAKQIMSEAGISQGAKFSSLSPESLNALMNAHLKRESGGLYKYLQSQGGTTTLNTPSASDLYYFEKGMIKKDAKDEGITEQRYNEIAKRKEQSKSTDNPIVTTILGSGKFTKDQSAAISNAINTGEDPYTVIKNQAKGLMAAPTRTDVENFELARDEMLNIQSLIKQYYDNGGETNIFKGSYEKVINKLGEVNDPELVTLATNIASALQSYRNAVSGTAYSVKEGIEIESVFPGIKKSKALNDAIIKGRLQSFNTKIDSAYANVLGANTYNQLKVMYENNQPSQTQVSVPKSNYQYGVGNTNILSNDLSKLLGY